jgi:hypothetical protein
MIKKTTIIFLLALAPLSNLFAQSDSVGAGYALKFKGIDGRYVDVGDNLNSLNFPFTIESWILLNTYPTPQQVIFSSDDSMIYSGFWLNINSAGQIILECGDNLGAGYQYRAGAVTTTSIPLNQWVHVAVVCNSIGHFQFYYNGVLQNSVLTDGTASIPSLFHNSGHGEIGDWLTLSAETPFRGQIDELRIWNTARTHTQIRQNMCSRISPTPDLVAYWRGTGSLTDAFVKDYALVPHDGIIVGGVTKVVSGAPVGDYSIASYGTLTGKIISVTDPSGDIFRVSAVTGDPNGVIVYGTDGAPYRTNGITTFPSHYFGVFCAENSSPATFKVSYQYSNATLGDNNEADARIFLKATDSSTKWMRTTPLPDTLNNVIVKMGLVTRGEFILNFITSPMLLSQQAPALPEAISAYPNPAHNYVVLSFSNLSEPVNAIRIVDLTGKVIREIQNPLNTSLNLDINNWNGGLYFAEAMTAKGNYFTRFIIQ